MSIASRPFPHSHSPSVVERTAQTMFLLKSVPSTQQIFISVNGAASHTWSMRIPLQNWRNLVPVVESSINSAFQNEAFEVTVSYNEMEEKKAFSRSKVDLTDVFGAVVPRVEVD